MPRALSICGESSQKFLSLNGGSDFLISFSNGLGHPSSVFFFHSFLILRAAKYGQRCGKVLKDDDVLARFWYAMDDGSGASEEVARAALQQSVITIQQVPLHLFCDHPSD